MSNTQRAQTTLVFAAESSSSSSNDRSHMESDLPDHTLVKRQGWGRDKCVVVVVAFALVAAVAGAFALAMYITSGSSALGGATDSEDLFPGRHSVNCNGTNQTGCGGVAKDDAFNNTTKQRVGVVLGNGCFWERQYAYVMLERTDSLFGRGLYNLTSRAGYAGGPGTGLDGKVCYHHSGGDQTDVYR
eukprot:INCI7467.2.p1 GENE.INCI7467.2~~INCI7467.2.p1  ORF type:complete len:205 (+),score=36.37 INCI7467.2:55-615(+)